MRFLADENIPFRSVALLREHGHDVVWIAEEGRGASDKEVLQHSVAESRVLLTFNRDFGELVYRLQMPVPPGIVYLRFIPESPTETSEIVENALCQPGLFLKGHFTVLHRDHIRQRPLQ